MKLKMLVAIASLAIAGLAIPASAEEGDISVNVPFEFIVGTQTLPAGKYTVSRASSLAATSPLLVSSHDRGVILLPGAFDGTSSGDASLSFDQIGSQRVLTQIKTPAGTYTIEDHREAERLARITNGAAEQTG